jgi:hypothetical protein
MNKTFTELLERQELIQKLIDRGYGQLIDVLLMDDSYTKKGRLNKSAVCRKLGWKPKQLEDALKECKILLLSDFGWEDEEVD